MSTTVFNGHDFSTSTSYVSNISTGAKSWFYTDTLTDQSLLNIVVTMLGSETMYGRYEIFLQVTQILSLVLSATTLMTVICIAFIRPDIAKKPSIRLSGWMALTDIIFSLILFLMLQYQFMTSRKAIDLGILDWLRWGMSMTFVLLNTCIAIQLHLTVLANKPRLARKLNYGYEAVSILVGMGLPAILFKLRMLPVWNPKLIRFMIYTEVSKSNIKYLLCDFLWEFIAMFYCLVVIVLVLYKIFVVSRDVVSVQTYHPDHIEPLTSSSSSNINTQSASPSCLEDQTRMGFIGEGRGEECTALSPTLVNSKSGDSNNNSQSTTLTVDRQNNLRKATLRILLYPLVLLIIRVPYTLSVFIAPNPIPALYLTYTLCSIQGTVNFIVFLINPSLSELWPLILTKLRQNY
ncbi:hypothetical protein H4219_004077 [Mycoemilia scoparia]|uniref:Uncharacterized protein n=1 Tax=Mycoemilia scoparia TaxID=417184 RepID=A0A9W7ZZE7_9FUNG|nr:hypothetical protein H4219_004077 [Mycoemilia scoparia]